MIKTLKKIICIPFTSQLEKLTAVRECGVSYDTDRDEVHHD